LLCDAHLKESFRACVGDDVGAGGIGQVTIQNQDARILVNQFDQGLAEGDALRFGGGHR